MTKLQVSMLSAQYGDCIWVDCRVDGRTRRIVVDGGTPSAGARLATRLAALPSDDRHVDLFVVSHVDADHIGGALTVLRRPPAGLTIDEVWFNDRRHVPAPRGVHQGQRLAALLDDLPDTYAWNTSFGGAAVTTGGVGDVRVVELDWGARLTVLSPTPDALVRLGTVWDETVREARAGEPSAQEPQPVPRGRRRTLEDLASTSSQPDRTVANGSSIAVLLEVGRHSALLCADASATVLAAAVQTIAASRGEKRLAVDAVKLPHHGSQGNVSVELLELVRSRRWLFSTNGDRFRHPDPEAVARVILHGGKSPTLYFNYRSRTTRRWGDPTLMEQYGYQAVYPNGRGAGVTVEV